jgi:hypothetical protein
MPGTSTRRRTFATILVAVTAALFATGSARAAQGDPFIDACLVRSTLTTLANCTPALPSHPVALAESPDGNQIYAGVWQSTAGSYYGLQIFDRNPATGAVTSRAGTAGCFAATGSGAPCTLVGGSLSYAYDIAASPDGKSVYVPSAGSSTLVEFTRNAATGSLTYQGCIGATAGCTALVGNGGALAVTVSPDNKNVYLRTESGLAVFDRNTTTGALVQRAGAGGCFTDPGVAGCTPAAGLAGEGYKLRVSPDGSYLYVPFTNPGGISFFNRFSDGSLTQITGTAGGCISSTGASGGVNNQCMAGSGGLATSYVTAVSPDGKSVYVGGNSGLTSYSRNSITGVLTQSGCFGGTAGCGAVTPAFPGVFDIEVTPDGADVVVASVSAPTLLFYTRNQTTGVLTQRPSPKGCMTGAINASCTTLTGLGSLSRLAIDPGGLFIYVSALTSGMLATLDRDFAPVCQAKSVAVPFNTAIAVSLDCSDVNNNPMTLSITSPPNAGGLGAIDQAAARVFYNPFSNYSGPDQFQYQASARGATSPPVTVSLGVAGPPLGSAPPAPTPTPTPTPTPPKPKTITSTVAYNWSVRGSTLTLRQLLVRSVPTGATVEITCSGKKCPFKSKKVKRGSKTSVDLLKALGKKKTFRASQTLEIRISASGFNSKVLRFTLKKSKLPTGVAYCIPVGKTKIQKTC